MAWQIPGCQLGVTVAASSFLPALPSPCPYLPNYALGFSLATCPGTGGWKESFSFLRHKLVEDGKHRCQRTGRNALALLLHDGGANQPDGVPGWQKQPSCAHRKGMPPYPATCSGRRCQQWHRCGAASRGASSPCTCPQSSPSRWAAACKG